MGKVPGIFCLNTDCKHYFEDNCMKFFEENTLNISNAGKCEDFEPGECEGYQDTNTKNEEMLVGLEIDDLICGLLEELAVQEDNNIVFTSRSVELIHWIAEMCNDIPIVQKTKEQAEDCAEGLSAEQVYMDMLVKIVEAPTKRHMLMSARILIPIIDQKLREGEKDY